MADKSKIEWTDATWTPIRARRRDTGKVGVHCERVSPACKNCYADALNRRNLPSHGTGLDFTVPNRELVDIFVDEEMLLQPLRWRRGRKIFVCSQTDLFGDFVSDEQIDRVFSVMAIAQRHTFQVLTKRPERMERYFRDVRPNLETAKGNIQMRWERPARFFPGLFDQLPLNREGFMPWPLFNVWLGVTAESQEWADKRIPVLKQTPAAKRFLSVEPMLGPVQIDLAGIDWVICGSESGRGARPMHPDWARSLRDQCQATGVPFFFKQWGEWQVGSGTNPNQDRVLLNDGTLLGMSLADVSYEVRTNWSEYRSTVVSKVGKRASGRLLDGREWNEFPEVIHVA